jgi:hypothetical protein
LQVCELCRGLRAHKVLLSNMQKEVIREVNAARSELVRLRSLYADVCWYHFEISVQDWNTPWHVTLGRSLVTLHSRRVERGVTRWGFFYSGPVEEAPVLPPEVVVSELELAGSELAHWRRILHDITAYAPGGAAYTQLCENTLVGRDA